MNTKTIELGTENGIKFSNYQTFPIVLEMSRPILQIKQVFYILFTTSLSKRDPFQKVFENKILIFGRRTTIIDAKL